MEIKDSIEKAIEGGWTHRDWQLSAASLLRVTDHFVQSKTGNNDWHDIFEIESMLLDPKFWQALGKTLGWDSPTGRETGTVSYQEATGEPYWLYRMHRMIDALADGKTIEEYIATL